MLCSRATRCSSETSAGRTFAQALGWSATDLGALLYASLRDKLLPLPDSSLVYPAHGAGSLCGKAIGKETVSTIGEQRASNYALQPMSQAAFIDLVTADQPDAPAYFTYDAVLNNREHPTLEQALARELKPLTIDALLAEQARGAQVLDTRDSAEFAAAHLGGSINIGLAGQYATWVGTMLTHDQPIAIIADPGAETESALRLGRIGFDQVIGYLEGGLASADSPSTRIATTERVGADVAASRMASATPSVIVDVRAATERAQKRIGGSIHIPLNHLGERLSEIPAGRPVILHCAGGYRSSIAASLLQRDGFTRVSELAGGIAAWETAGLPVITQ